MSEIQPRGKDQGGAVGNGTSGSWAPKGQGAPEVEVTAVTADAPSTQELLSREYDAMYTQQQRVHEVALKGILEEARGMAQENGVDATQAHFKYNSDFDGGSLSFMYLSDASGEMIEVDETAEIERYSDAFDTFDDLRNYFDTDSDDYEHFTLDLTPQPSDLRTTAMIDYELEKSAKISNAENARIFDLGVAGVKAVLADHFAGTGKVPTAVVIEDNNKGGSGAPFFIAVRVEDADGVIWENDGWGAEDDDGLADALTDYTTLLDRDEDRLDDPDDEDRIRVTL